jgi:argininosuccinate lyase
MFSNEKLQKLRETFLETKQSLLQPESRADMVNMAMILMICDQLEELNKTLKELNQKLVVEAPSKPGRKPKNESKEE